MNFTPISALIISDCNGGKIIGIGQQEPKISQKNKTVAYFLVHRVVICMPFAEDATYVYCSAHCSLSKMLTEVIHYYC